MKKKKLVAKRKSAVISNYKPILKNLVKLINDARSFSARAVNAVMTATYWEIGRHIIEEEQKGKKRAQYGKALITKLSDDLTKEFGKGFSDRNLRQMRQFYLYKPI
ncbi:MAG: DUF1016 N-terminal domain-containing protein, partial [Elusimicrobiota bacterium]|nr:DUF1016 N-terminal domain-containing protein [Elusimicrobiota bacterium]